MVVAMGIAPVSATPLLAARSDALARGTAPAAGASSAWVQDAYARLPLSFEQNIGQSDPTVDFLARGSGYTLFLAQGEAVLALRAHEGPSGPMSRRTAALGMSDEPSLSAVLRIGLAGGNSRAQAAAEQPLPGRVNYFIGSDPSHWHVDVPTYARITYPAVYPGVDLVYYGDQGRLEYDLVVRPGADPRAIALRYEGHERLEIDTRGDLVLGVGAREVRQAKPILYQELGGERRPVSGAYVLRDAATVGLVIGDYDNAAPLVIDPTLSYSTYLGGSGGDGGVGIAVDAAGSAYVTGGTLSTNFPTTAGAFQTATGGGEDAFVTKLNPAGSALVYSTYLGGNGTDLAVDIAVDAAGSAYVTGDTFSTNFPTTAGSFQTATGGREDAFVTKLNPAGSALVYSTYLGGSGSDDGRGIAVDSAGSAYVTGESESTNFPTTAGAFQTATGGGTDAFVTKLNPAGSALMYSTYLGGSGVDEGVGIAVDAAGSGYVTGGTSSTNFPTTVGAFQTALGGGEDAFVAKITAAGAPATLTLSPATAMNTVGQQHCVTATVRDALLNPVPGITVRFSVPTHVATFATPFTGSAVSDANGQATFCFTASLPGVDDIHAFADTNNNNMQDLGELFGDATKIWTPPTSTKLCEVIITDGGWIIANNTDQASFGGNAKVLADGSVQGQQQYQDHGPVQPMTVHSTEIVATTCNVARMTASIFGKATIDGTGSHVFRIDVTDMSKTGGADTYGIMLDTGYLSGQHALGGGQITIR